MKVTALTAENVSWIEFISGEDYREGQTTLTEAILVRVKALSAALKAHAPTTDFHEDQFTSVQLSIPEQPHHGVVPELGLLESWAVQGDGWDYRRAVVDGVVKYINANTGWVAVYDVRSGLELSFGR